jgi:hypothetical protein
VGNQDLLQRLNRQEVASEQETCKKPTKASLPRRRKPLFELPGEEFAKRPNSKNTSRNSETPVGLAVRRRRAVLRAFQPNATGNANRNAAKRRQPKAPREVTPPGLTIAKSVAEKIHGVATRTKSPKMH